MTADDAIVMSGMPVGRRPARAGSRGRPAGHPDRRLADTTARAGATTRCSSSCCVSVPRRAGPHWPLLAHAHERAARHHRRLGDAAAAAAPRRPGDDVNLQLLVLREFTPRAAGDRATPGWSRRRCAGCPTGCATTCPALTRTGGAGRCAACGGTTPPRPPPTARSAQRPPRGDRQPDRELQADLAILEVWQARRGWRPGDGRGQPRRRGRCDCRHDAADRDRRPTTPPGISPLRSAWLMLDLAALQLWAGDLDLRRRARARRRRATPTRWSCRA